MSNAVDSIDDFFILTAYLLIEAKTTRSELIDDFQTKFLRMRDKELIK